MICLVSDGKYSNSMSCLRHHVPANRDMYKRKSSTHEHWILVAISHVQCQGAAADFWVSLPDMLAIGSVQLHVNLQSRDAMSQ